MQYTITCEYSATGTAGTLKSANCLITKDGVTVTVPFVGAATMVTSSSQFNPGTYTVDVEVVYTVDSTDVTWGTTPNTAVVVADADVTVGSFTVTNEGVS